LISLAHNTAHRLFRQFKPIKANYITHLLVLVLSFQRAYMCEPSNRTGNLQTNKLTNYITGIDQQSKY